MLFKRRHFLVDFLKSLLERKLCKWLLPDLLIHLKDALFFLYALSWYPFVYRKDFTKDATSKFFPMLVLYRILSKFGFDFLCGFFHYKECTLLDLSDFLMFYGVWFVIELAHSLQKDKTTKSPDAISLHMLEFASL